MRAAAAEAGRRRGAASPGLTPGTPLVPHVQASGAETGSAAGPSSDSVAPLFFYKLSFVHDWHAGN